MTPTHIVSLKETTLSDGSFVYSIEITEHETNVKLVLDAIDRDAAFRAATAITNIFNKCFLAKAETRDYTKS